MLRDEFIMYAEGVRKMLSHNRTWRTTFEATLPQFFPRNESRGYSTILAALATEAYDIVEAQERGTIVPDELAALLRVRSEQKNYKRAAYYFAITVFAVAMYKLDEDEADPERIDADELFEFDTSAIIPTETDGITASLLYYKNRLLDFSRNNQLVHFRNTKNGTLLLRASSLPNLLGAIAAGKKIYIGKWNELRKKPKQIMRCKSCNRYSFRPYDPANARFAEKCPVCDVKGTGNRKSLVSIPEGLTVIDELGYACPNCGSYAPAESVLVESPVCMVCAQPIEIPSYPVMTAASLEAQFGKTTVIPAVSDTASVSAADNLMRKAERLERNFGLHALYLACGFLDWVDASGTNYHSPILLSRINLHLDRGAGRYYFQLDTNAEAPFVVNKTLFRMLSAYSHTVSIPLPDYSDLGGRYFDELRNLWKATNASVAAITENWRISSDLGIGFFHYQKLQLERDIERNMPKYLAHPIIRRLCGDTDLIVEDAPKLSDSLEHLTMDADSSQETVIRASQEGHSFILQGPPGSGKSQTISNIISVAIGEGKTVLFVTEKATARSIIVDNLAGRTVDGTHTLANFVLDFDKFSTRRGAIGQKPLLEEINNAREPAITVTGFDRVIEEEKYYREQIDSYMTQLTGTHEGRSYQNYIQDIAPYVEYSALRSLEEKTTALPPLPELVSKLREYYSLVAEGAVGFDYREDALFGMSGADSYTATVAAERYIALNREREEVYQRLLDTLNLNADETIGTVSGLAEALEVWVNMPALDTVTLSAIGCVADIERLEKYARDRSRMLLERDIEPGKRHTSDVNATAVDAYPAGAVLEFADQYKNAFKRLSKKYKKTLNSIFEYSNNRPKKIKYKQLRMFGEQLEEYRRYHLKASAYRAGEDKDLETFGRVIDTGTEWKELCTALEAAKRVLNNNKSRTVPLAKNGEFIKRFSHEEHEYTVSQLREFSRELRDIASEEAELSSTLKPYFARLAPRNLGGHQKYRLFASLSERISGAGDRFMRWSRVSELIAWMESTKTIDLLDELIRKNVVNPLEAENMVNRAYYVKVMRDFVKKNSLDMLKSFTSGAHIDRIRHYATADLETLKGGATRLYNTLSERMNAAGAEYKRLHRSTLDLPKIQAKTGASISQVIKENWEYIKHIKPCFMMSPLNASQYIDIGLEFDMVIFDEASQIFTEDALASIVRGKQVIIAGDSKQLPPCDFFRAGGSHGDIADEESAMVEDDNDAKDSLLIAADKALGDISISLDWHYRSYDEALIAFSNENFGYNLVTFPSAIKNPNDGIEMVKVPYAPNTCYIAGKRGTHINSGEADAIVQLLWREINHPERSSFSLGVVAFSNAQALEIENRWRAFKEKDEYKATVDAWEAAHENEPIIFCNLDTMQGDERDTMLLSICYSPDPDGRFNLTFLGSIRLEGGKKRINVAITRSRHRMIVVSTLEVYTLANAIATSSAPDHNKEGADTLCRFLSYAETFRNENKPVTAPPTNAFTRAICRALDKQGIAYDTEIGRSECRISIGIKDKSDPNSYVLGIIVDDPNRTDFASAREYSRLTEQVLCGKYGWKIYRVFPIAWISSYKAELDKLMNAVNRALSPAEE